MSATLLPGYRMRRLIHRGHSFDVHDAWSTERGCPVVVKVARPSAGPAAAKRLVREGYLLRRLTHPHLVSAYEVVRAPRAAVVLETLPGTTLTVLFDRHGALPVADTAEMGRQVASVLGYLHRSGYVHADLKPDNAVVEAGRLKLIDLSLVRRPGLWRSSAGSPGYLAPEQAARTWVGPATDVWGLGLLLLEATAGEEAYPVGCPEYDEDKGPLAPPRPLRARRRVPRALSELLEACTTLEPERRPTLDAVVDTLESFLPKAGRGLH